VWASGDISILDGGYLTYQLMQPLLQQHLKPEEAAPEKSGFLEKKG